jgi:hypothetical protein
MSLYLDIRLYVRVNQAPLEKKTRILKLRICYSGLVRVAEVGGSVVPGF